jgi:hypothetical protein
MQHRLEHSRGIAHNLDVRVCSPVDWQAELSDAPGVLEGVVSARRDSGLYVFRLTPAYRLSSLPDEQVVRRLMRTVLGRYAHLFPRRLRLSASEPEPYFLGGSGFVVRYYNYGSNGLMRAGGAMTDDGEVVLGFTFGPYAELDQENDALTVAWYSASLVE